MSELAVEYVSIVPSFKGGASAIRKGLSGSAVTNAARQSGRGVGAALMAGAKRVAVGTAVGVGFAGGAALLGGFKSAISQQNAKQVFSGLYGSAKGATDIMNRLRKVASDSPIDYDAYLKAGQNLAYAGVKGKGAAKTLKNVGLAITAVGGSSEDMDRATTSILDMVNSGEVQWEMLRNLSNTGVPIISGLAKHFDVPMKKVREMASKGEIALDDVLSVMENATGKTYQQMVKAGDKAGDSFGNTWKKVKDNINVAIGQNIAPALDKLAPVLQKVGNWAVKAIGKIPGLIDKIMPTIQPVIDGFKTLFTGDTKKGFTEIGDAISDIIPGFDNMKTTVPGLKTTMKIFSGILKFVSDNLATIMKWLPTVIGAFLLWKAASVVLTKVMGAFRLVQVLQQVLMFKQIGATNRLAAANTRLALATSGNTTATSVNNGAQKVGLLTRLRGVATMVAQKTALVATTVATKTATIAQKAMNLAMRMNPIGLIITGILALVAGLVWFFTQTKAGKAIITAVWSAIKIAIGAVVNWFTGTVVPFFQAAIAKIVLGFQLFKAAAAVAWNGFKTVLGIVWNWVKTYVFTPIANFVTKTIPNAFNFLVNAVKIYINAWKLVLTTVWNFVKKWVFTPIYNFVFRTIPDAFKFLVSAVKIYINNWKRILNVVWQWVKTYVFNPIKRFVMVTIPDAFRLFVSYIKSRMNNFKNNLRTIWTWVKDHVFNPMRDFITETVPNAFKKGVDMIKTFWDKLKKVASKPMKFVIDTVYNNGLVKLWNPIADFIGKEDWKLSKVSTKNFATGGRVRGPGTSTSDSVPARLSNNEHVLSAKDVKNLGGHSGVYGLRKAAAQGWTPGLASGGTLSDAARWLQSKGARITEFKAWGQRVGKHSNGSQHYTGEAFDANAGPGGTNSTEQRIFDRLVPQLHSLFPKLKTLWKVAGHWSHLHVGTGAGGKVGSGGSGGGGWVPGLDKLVDWVKGKLGGIGSGRMAEGMSGMTTKFIDGMADKVRSVFDFFGGGGGGGSEPAADVVAAVRNVAKGYGWDTGQQWRSLRWLIDKESSWDPNAANPSSSARGLFQKMTSIHGAVEPTAAGQAKWGLNYIEGRYTDPIGAQAFHRGHNYYADGTLSAMPGWAWVGEQGPELMKLRGGEQIKSNRSSYRHAESRSVGVSADDVRSMIDDLELTLIVGGEPMDAYISAHNSRIFKGAGRAH